MINCATHADTLMQAAREHATLAFAGLLTGDRSSIGLRTAAIHAGAAVELLTKAIVWQVNPLLILQIEDPSHRDAFVANRGVLSDQDLDRTSTVKAYEALHLATLAAGLVSPASKNAPREVDLAKRVLGARNQAAHMATTPDHPDTLADNLAQFLRVFLPADYCLAPAPDDQQTHFLTDHALTMLVEERHGAIHGRLQAKIEQARATHEDLVQSMLKQKQPEGKIREILRNKALKSAERVNYVEADFRPSMLQDCPACGYPACSYMVVTAVEMDEDGNLEASYETLLACGCCELFLDAQELALSRQDNPAEQTPLGDPEDYLEDSAIDFIDEPTYDEG